MDVLKTLGVGKDSLSGTVAINDDDYNKKIDDDDDYNNNFNNGDGVDENDDIYYSQCKALVWKQ